MGMTMTRTEKAGHGEQFEISRTTLRRTTGTEHSAPGPRFGAMMTTAEYVALRMPGRRPAVNPMERKLIKQGYEPTARGSLVKRTRKI